MDNQAQLQQKKPHGRIAAHQGAATSAFDATSLQLQKYPRIARGEIAHTVLLAIIKTSNHDSTRWADCLLWLRFGMMILALGSPLFFLSSEKE